MSWNHLEQDAAVVRAALALKRATKSAGTTLSYYTPLDGKLKGSLDIRDCSPRDIQIMPSDCLKTRRSNASIWRIAIQTPGRRFIMAARSENDMLDWANAFDSVILRRPRMSSTAETTASSILYEAFKDSKPRRAKAA
ncbi:hypothetical protein LEN26_002621 [Aphanomyces euteiches]|nr:hypothetical protein AeMF1_018644 [Aphanomyces euteiches]KAH9158945.1 hypothetical protein LEN26_002621 [Aphanomyces euteiches]